MKDVVLIADPNSNAWDFSQKIQSYLLNQKRTQVPLDAVEISHFGNKELDIHVPRNLRGKEIYFIHDSTDNPQEWLVKTLLINNLFLLASAEHINYVFPDMKYSRQDRKHKPRVPISATILPSCLKPYWPTVKRIFTMDLHAEQLVGNYAPIPMENLPSTPSLVRFLKEHNGIPDLENLVVVAADQGDAKRAERLSNKLNTVNPPAFIYKERDRDTRELTNMRLIGTVKDKRVLIPDDIIDSGKTLRRARNLLKKEGALEIYCYATHGWFTKGTGIITRRFNRTIVSNTNNKDYGSKVEVMDVSPLFAEVMYRAYKGESVSECYE